MTYRPRATAPLSSLFQGSEQALEGGSFVKYLLKKHFSIIDYGEIAFLFPPGLINRVRVFIARLILPQAVGVLVEKKPPEENPIPQYLSEYVESVQGNAGESKRTSSQEGIHEQG